MESHVSRHTLSILRSQSSAMSNSKRALSLHNSALSDEEYEAYTSSLSELLYEAPGPSVQASISTGRGNNGDNDWESARLSVREVRGWLRGRYGGDISIRDIDKVCVS